MTTPEARARQTIDALLTAAGWHVCNTANANIHAARGVAIREFQLATGYGFADYLPVGCARARYVVDFKSLPIDFGGLLRLRNQRTYQ